MPDKADLIAQPQPGCLRLQFCRVRTFAGDGRSHAAAGSLKDGQSLDQYIHGLYRPQFPHADDIGGVRPRHRRLDSDSAMPLRTMRTMARGGATTLR